jgi:hypothetical protein
MTPRARCRHVRCWRGKQVCVLQRRRARRSRARAGRQRGATRAAAVGPTPRFALARGTTTSAVCFLRAPPDAAHARAGRCRRGRPARSPPAPPAVRRRRCTAADAATGALHASLRALFPPAVSCADPRAPQRHRRAVHGRVHVRGHHRRGAEAARRAPCCGACPLRCALSHCDRVRVTLSRGRRRRCESGRGDCADRDGQGHHGRARARGGRHRQHQGTAPAARRR